MRVVFVLFGLFASVCCKVYERCELARELKSKHKMPEEQIATWVCIARHESEYNTSAVGHLNWDGSGDHGLFQISDLYWCSPPGAGWACGVACQQLVDDDIADDVTCAKRIHRQHQRLAGDGFTAWAVYRHHCSGSQVSEYVEGCFDASTTVRSTVDNEVVKLKDKDVEHVKDDKDNIKVATPAEHTEQLTPSVRPATSDTVKDGLELKLKEGTVFNVDEATKTNVDVLAVTKVDEVVKVGRKNEKPDLMKPSLKTFNRYYAKLYEFVNTGK